MNKAPSIPKINLQTHVHLIVTQGKLVLRSERIAIHNSKRAA